MLDSIISTFTGNKSKLQAQKLDVNNELYKAIILEKEGDNDAAYKTFSRLADVKVNNMNAQFKTGMMLCEGRGVGKDVNKGIAMLERAADQGHHDALIYLDSWYIGGGYDSVKGIAANVANLEATYNSDSSRVAAIKIALVHLGPNGSWTDATYYLKEATTKGSGEAALLLGKLYLSGHINGIPKSAKDAVFYLEQAVTLKSHKAALLLGELYANGHEVGIEKDIDKAVDYFKEAINLGSPDAEFKLHALIGKQSPDSPSNSASSSPTRSPSPAKTGYNDIVESLKKEAEAELAKARALELSGDHLEALAIYIRHAGCDNHEAQLKAAQMLCEGRNSVCEDKPGVPVDEKKGLAFLDDAVDDGYPPALTYYGIALREGRYGLKADTTTGTQYLQEAKEKGDPDAAAYLAGLEAAGEGHRHEILFEYTPPVATQNNAAQIGTLDASSDLTEEDAIAIAQALDDNEHSEIVDDNAAPNKVEASTTTTTTTTQHNAEPTGNANSEVTPKNPEEAKRLLGEAEKLLSRVANLEDKIAGIYANTKAPQGKNAILDPSLLSQENKTAVQSAQDNIVPSAAQAKGYIMQAVSLGRFKTIPELVVPALYQVAKEAAQTIKKQGSNFGITQNSQLRMLKDGLSDDATTEFKRYLDLAEELGSKATITAGGNKGSGPRLVWLGIITGHISATTKGIDILTSALNKEAALIAKTKHAAGKFENDADKNKALEELREAQDAFNNEENSSAMERLLPHLTFKSSNVKLNYSANDTPEGNNQYSTDLFSEYQIRSKMMDHEASFNDNSFLTNRACFWVAA